MDPLQIKKYLANRKRAPLRDIAIHFRMDAGAIEPMLEIWLRKGKVKKISCEFACRCSCCDCDRTASEIYEWIG